MDVAFTLLLIFFVVLSMRYVKLKKQIQLQKEHNDQLIKQKNDIDGQLIQLTELQKNLQLQKEQINDEFIKQKNEFDMQIIQSSGLQNQIQNLQQRYQKYEAIEKIDTEISRLKFSYATKKQEEEVALQKSLNDLSNRVNLVKQEYAIKKQEAEAVLEKSLNELNNRINVAKQENIKLTKKLKELQTEILLEEETKNLQQAGFFQPRYDFANATGYAAKLEEIRQNQKQMIKLETAIVCSTEWSVNGNKAEGRKQISRILKLGLAAFNVQADNIILKVKFNNLQKSIEGIRKVATNVNKLLETNDCTITPQFLNLKIDELQVVFEYQEKLYQEAEEQRQIREVMKEEERERKDMERAKLKAEKDIQLQQQALDKARLEYEKALAEARKNQSAQQSAFAYQQAELEQKLRELESKLEEAKQNERAISQAQLTSRGHVYIISNIGSFGQDVYKIGMTRRLEPLHRVKELGDASVPFSFDVHAMIYTENAPALERELHKRFDDMRLNKVNARKEFFRVSLDEIRKVVVGIKPDADFVVIPEAKEFRQSNPHIDSADVIEG